MSSSRTFRLSFDTAQSERRLKLINSELKQLNTGLGRTSREWINTQAQAKKAEAAYKEIHGSLKQSAGAAKNFFSANTIGLLGFSLSIKALISNAHSFNQEIKGWYNNFAKMSDASGDATKAVNLMFKTFGGSKASLSTIQGVMGSINAQGLSVEKMGNLPTFISNLTVASGISADALAGLTAGMQNLWQVSEKGSMQMVDSMIGLQQSFGMTSSEIELTMNTVKDSIGKVGVFFKDADKEANAFTKGLGASIGVMRKFGINTQKASEFMSKLTDPDSIKEMQPLLAQLGISFGEQMKMLEGDGKETFFDKVMEQLPNVANKLASITSPLARADMAKSLGLPMEIASRMAGKSKAEIQKLIREYKSEKDQAAKKEKNAKEEASKFDEQLHLLKMQALMPLMKWLNGTGYNAFFKILQAVSIVMQKALNWITKIMDSSGFNKFINDLSNMNLKQIVTEGLSVIGRAIVEMFKESGWIGKAIMIALAAFKIGSAISGLNTLAGFFNGGVGLGGVGKKAAGMAKTAGTAVANTRVGGAVVGAGKKIGSGAAKFGGKALAKLGLKGAITASKAIPVLGEVVMVADALYSVIDGAVNADKTFGKDKESLKKNSTYNALTAKRLAGKKLNADEQAQMNATKVTGGERFSSAIGGLVGGLTFGLVDGDKLSKNIQHTAFGENLNIDEVKKNQEIKAKMKKGGALGKDDINALADQTDKTTSGFKQTGTTNIIDFLGSKLATKISDSFSTTWDDEKKKQMTDVDQLLKMEQEGKIKLSADEHKIAIDQQKLLRSEKEKLFSAEENERLRKYQLLIKEGHLNKETEKRVKAEIDTLEKKKKAQGGFMNRLGEWGMRTGGKVLNFLGAVEETADGSGYKGRKLSGIGKVIAAIQAFAFMVRDKFIHFTNWLSSRLAWVGANIGAIVSEKIASLPIIGLSEKEQERLHAANEQIITDLDKKANNEWAAFKNSTYDNAHKTVEKMMIDMSVQSEEADKRAEKTELIQNKLLQAQQQGNQLAGAGIGVQKEIANNIKKDSKTKTPDYFDAILASNSIVTTSFKA